MSNFLDSKNLDFTKIARQRTSIIKELSRISHEIIVTREGWGDKQKIRSLLDENDRNVDILEYIDEISTISKKIRDFKKVSNNYPKWFKTQHLFELNTKLDELVDALNEYNTDNPLDA